MAQAKHQIRKLARLVVYLTAVTVLIACGQQSSPTVVVSTASPTETTTERSTPETVPDPTVTVELMPTLAGVVFSHDESLWQINQDGKPVKVLGSFSDFFYAKVSWDSKRIIFEQEKQLWVVSLTGGERRSITDGSQPLCCFGWVQGQSGIAHYAFKRPGSRDFEHYPVTMTVIYFANDSLEILEEKQFNEVSRFASVSPDGYRLAYHDGDGAWIIQGDQSTEPFDAKEYGMTVPPDAILTNPAWSPDGSRIAWTISGTFHGKYQTALVVFDLSGKTSRQLHQYDAIEGTQSIQWLRPRIMWSPDNNWIALEAGDAAFGDDSGVWVFSSNDMQKHHIMSTGLIGWSWDSKHLCHRFKDYSGCVDVSGWQEHRLTPLPFDSWGFIGWTMPVEGV